MSVIEPLEQTSAIANNESEKPQRPRDLSLPPRKYNNKILAVPKHIKDACPDVELHKAKIDALRNERRKCIDRKIKCRSQLQDNSMKHEVDAALAPLKDKFAQLKSKFTEKLNKKRSTIDQIKQTEANAQVNKELFKTLQKKLQQILPKNVKSKDYDMEDVKGRYFDAMKEMKDQELFGQKTPKQEKQLHQDMLDLDRLGKQIPVFFQLLPTVENTDRIMKERRGTVKDMDSDLDQIKKRMTEVHLEMDAKRQSVASNQPDKDSIRQELDDLDVAIEKFENMVKDLQEAHNQSWDDYKEAQREWWKLEKPRLELLNKKSFLEREAQRNERDNVRKQEDKARSLEGLLTLVMQCEQLKSYVQPYITPDNKSSSSNVIADSENTGDANLEDQFSGMKLSAKSKKGSDEEAFFAGKGKKGGRKGKKGKKGGNKVDNSRIAHSGESLAFFAKMNIPTPLTVSDAPKTMDALNALLSKYRELEKKKEEDPDFDLDAALNPIKKEKKKRTEESKKEESTNSADTEENQEGANDNDSNCIDTTTTTTTTAASNGVWKTAETIVDADKSSASSEVVEKTVSSEEVEEGEIVVEKTVSSEEVEEGEIVVEEAVSSSEEVEEREIVPEVSKEEETVTEEATDVDEKAVVDDKVEVVVVDDTVEEIETV